MSGFKKRNHVMFGFKEIHQNVGGRFRLLLENVFFFKFTRLDDLSPECLDPE